MSKPLSITTFISISFATIATAGEVATDGSMGTATNLTGPNYTISQDLGATVGNNLFHSFGTFNLNPGDVATFTGANTIQNVISRVTDGNPSSIDGTIASQVGNANFFFINPAGVVFGEHAAVNVPADFHVSTAQELRFADGSAYNLVTPKGSLTAAPPEAFGFLGATGNIVIESSQLKFKDGTEVSFTGGLITSNNATIEVPRGSLRVYGNDDAVSNVPINDELPVGNGAITMNGGKWSVNGNGGGNVEISADKININNNAQIHNLNSGTQDAIGDIKIEASTLIVDSSFILFSSLSTGSAGNLIINVTEIMQIINNSGIGTLTVAQGNAGKVTINVNGEMHILNGGRILSSTWATGNAGIVTITINRLIIDRQGSQFFTGISSDAQPNSGGNASSINITINGEMHILNGGTVSSSTFGQGNAGTVTITANRLIINMQNSQDYTGIASTADPDAKGNAGSINIIVNGEMQILNGGRISTSTFAGQAGNINITANQLLISGISNNNYPSTIISQNETETSGGAEYGAITITIKGEMQILNGGSVSSSTFGKSNAGTVTITANRLIIDGYDTQYFTV